MKSKPLSETEVDGDGYGGGDGWRKDKFREKGKAIREWLHGTCGSINEVWAWKVEDSLFPLTSFTIYIQEDG